MTWKTPPSAFVERCDKEAIDAIPDAEIECLLRTAEEAAFARALAERERLDRGEGDGGGGAPEAAADDAALERRASRDGALNPKPEPLRG